MDGHSNRIPGSNGTPYCASQPLALVLQHRLQLLTNGSTSSPMGHAFGPNMNTALPLGQPSRQPPVGHPLHNKSHVIAAGHVEGLAQIAYRAELTGVCEAIRFGPVAL